MVGMTLSFANVLPFVKSSLLGLLLVQILQSPVSSAADAPDFEKRKAEALTHLNEHIQKLQSHKSCVEAAKDAEALKACREDMQSWRKELRGQMKERRENRKQRRGQSTQAE